MAGREIQELQDGLRAARDEVLKAIHGITEEGAHEIPAPGEWSVAQLLGHIAELQVFWVGKALLLTKETDPQISRTAVESDQRIAAVTGRSQERIEDLECEVIAACEEAAAMVGGIDPQDLTRPGHREENPMTAASVIQYVARHVRDHANQITETRRLIRRKH